MGARGPIGAPKPPRFHCRTIKRRSGYPFGKPVAGRITRPLATRQDVSFTATFAENPVKAKHPRQFGRQTGRPRGLPAYEISIAF